jgi:hypothetical protein
MPLLGDVQLEEVAMALLIAVRQGLPSAISSVETEQNAKDAAWSASLGYTLPAVTLAQPVEYIPGHHPSLLERELRYYPSVVVMCYDHRSAPSNNAFDQIEEMANTAYVEMAFYDGDETLINRKAWRYAKALHRCVAKDPTLGGMVEEIVLSPTVMVSNASARRVSFDVDEVTYIQLCRLEYEFRVAQPW